MKSDEPDFVGERKRGVGGFTVKEEVEGGNEVGVERWELLVCASKVFC